MRIGAIPDLKLSQIQKIKEYDLYSISVYEGTKDEYYCFTTPEVAKAIDTYFRIQAALRRKADRCSPLFREQMLVDYTLKTV